MPILLGLLSILRIVPMLLSSNRYDKTPRTMSPQGAVFSRRCRNDIRNMTGYNTCFCRNEQYRGINLIHAVFPVPTSSCIAVTAGTEAGKKWYMGNPMINHM